MPERSSLNPTTYAPTTGPPSTSPDPPLASPDLSLIHLIHRGPDGWIPFGIKRQSNWQDLCSLPADSLHAPPPSVLDFLTTDAYFCLNGMYRPGRVKNRILPGVPSAYRSTNGLRYLNAVYTDLDLYKTTRGVEETLAAVESLRQAGAIPTPSITVRSGRGVWLLWLLVDK